MKLFSLQHIFTYSQFFVFHVLFVIVIAAYKNIATVLFVCHEYISQSCDIVQCK